MSPYTLHAGDNREVLKTLEANSVDAIVCDPPYHLTSGKKGGTGEASVNLESPYGRARVTTGFMGMTWDGGDVANRPETWAECLRVAKPGAWLLAFGGTRTFHRMACAIEDAGWELRDAPVRGHVHQPEDCPWLMGWMYGSGFPKSHNGEWGGTALKPAWEPIVCARKPLIGTVAENFAAYGTGGLNIDGCRVAAPGVDLGRNNNARTSGTSYVVIKEAMRIDNSGGLGRWPANLIHDGSAEVLAHFPYTASGTGAVKRSSGADESGNAGAAFGAESRPAGTPMISHGDEGSAGRFFMQCKGDHNDAWQDLNLPQENANTAEQSSSQQRQAAVSALVLAVSSALPEGLLCSGLSMAPFTSATGGELKRIADSVTQTIQSIDSRFWHESKPARLTLSLNHASDAEIQRRTDTTTITVNRWKSDGSAEPVTFSITPMSLEVGEKDCAPSMDGKRFMYCAKASKKDRNEGCESFEAKMPTHGRGHESGGLQVSDSKHPNQNNHPTVKPTDLMRYLCRLVTPPGGVLLDPFMGSGSTGKACVLEGRKFIGVDLNPEYIAIARARIEFAMRQGHQPSLLEAA